MGAVSVWSEVQDLNLDHDDGKHKARLFSSMLGMAASDADYLREVLLKSVALPVQS